MNEEQKANNQSAETVYQIKKLRTSGDLGRWAIVIKEDGCFGKATFERLFFLRMTLREEHELKKSDSFFFFVWLSYAQKNYPIIEYTPVRVLQKIVLSAVDPRRQADENPN